MIGQSEDEVNMNCDSCGAEHGNMAAWEATTFTRCSVLSPEWYQFWGGFPYKNI